MTEKLSGGVVGGTVSSKELIDRFIADREAKVSWRIQVYVPHGYFEYEVGRPEQAVEHAQEIMRRGVYRRTIPGGLEMHQVVKVKVIGPGMESQYGDTFRRT